MKALTIRQPWAWLIANGFKDIENRSWRTNYRGKFYIHAAKTMSASDKAVALSLYNGFFPDSNVPIKDAPDTINLLLGGIIGVAEIVDCVSESDSKWFEGDYGFVIKNAKTLPFTSCIGRLRFFEPEF